MKMIGNTAVTGRALLAGMICCFIFGCGQPEAAGYTEFAAREKSGSEKATSVDSSVTPATASQTKTPVESVADSNGSATKNPDNTATKKTDEKVNSGALNKVSNRVPSPSNPDQVAVEPNPAANGNNTTSTNVLDAKNTSSGNGSGTRAKVKVLVKSRKFKTEGPENAIRVSYDDIDLLKVLNMDPVTLDAPKLMPQWLKDLDGKRIRIRGFMYPPFQETGLENFLMARDNQICCFVRKAKIYDLFPVSMRKGITTNYIDNRPFDVVGVFRIKAEVEDGEFLPLYAIEDAIVAGKR